MPQLLQNRRTVPTVYSSGCRAFSTIRRANHARTDDSRLDDRRHLFKERTAALRGGMNVDVALLSTRGAAGDATLEETESRPAP